VTYGADGKTRSEGGADLLQYEEEGYRYFAELGDQNLSRVLQYTAMYQFFRASSASSKASGARARFLKLSKLFAALGEQPAASSHPDVIADGIRKLFDDIDADRLKSDDPRVQNAIDAIGQFRKTNMDTSLDDLVPLLADRQKLAEVIKPRMDDWMRRVNELDAQKARLEDHPEELATLMPEIEEQQKVLDQQRVEMEKTRGTFQELTIALSVIANGTSKLDDVRTKFVEAHARREVRGSIRTPSIVTSWNGRHTMTTTGGHNLTARSLKFQQVDDVQGIRLVSDESNNPVLQYDAAHAQGVLTHTGELAREVEHGKVFDSSALTAIAETQAEIRPIVTALAQTERPPAIGSVAGFGRIGGRVYADKTDFVEDLRTLAANNDCCVFVARDKGQVAYATEINLKPPPLATAYEFRDTPSLTSELLLLSKRAGSGNQRAVIFLDEPPEHVQALMLSMGMSDHGAVDPVALAKAAIGAGTSTDKVAAIVQRDLEGRPSWLRVFKEAANARAREFLGRASVVRPAEVWARAKVDTLDNASLNDILGAADWNAGRDGTPAAVRVSFEPVAPYQASSVSLIAGFNMKSTSNAGAMLLRATQRTQYAAAQVGASPAQFLMTARAQLSGLPPQTLQRLLLVVEDDDGKALFTLRWPLTGEPTRG
jgi:hypothetical protein